MLRSDAIQLALKSAKFRNWKPFPKFKESEHPRLIPHVHEQHYTVPELAKLWAISPQAIRKMFENHPGVLKIERKQTKYKRRYTSIRIPHSVAEKVHGQTID